NGSVAELEANARRELAAGRPDGPPVGRDASDSIWFTLNGDFRVESIEVSRQWKDKLDSGHFAAALFQAYTDALSTVMQARASEALAAEAAGGGPVTPAATVPELDDPRWFRDLVDEVERVTSELDSYHREAAQLGAEQYDRELTSPEEIFTMRVRGT